MKRGTQSPKAYSFFLIKKAIFSLNSLSLNSLLGIEVSIEDFKLIKVIGRGAFGKVMLVQKNGTDDLYALKSIRKEDIIQKDQIEHTKTERKILEYVA